MDDGLDDLFGDAPPLQLPDPLPKGLSQHVDELSLSGCCQQIAWSKNGCIAYISQDARNVILRHLLCDPHDGQWRMSKESFIEDLPHVHNEHQVVHLSWSHAGTEIAIVDVFGQISIYNVFLAINRLTAMKRCTLDQDNLSAVIGLMWVYSDRWGFLNQPMQKTAAEGWVFKCSQRRLLGPRNPSNRPALVAITRNGLVRVLSQSQDSRWQDFKTEIENKSSPSELLTHAALCPEKIADKLSPDHESAILVATYNSDKELRLHEIRIDFEHSKIDLHHLKVLDQCSPQDGAIDGNVMNDDALPSHAQLSLLELIPPGPKSGTRDLSPPFILASFSHVSDDSGSGSGQQSHFTVICKWELQTTSPKLHTSFDSLSSKKTSASSVIDLPAEYLLQRRSDTVVPGILLAIHQANMSTIVVLLYSDGLVEYRDRTSMEILAQDIRDQFSTLGQIGFDTSLKRPSLLEVVNEAFVMQGSLAAMHFSNYNDDLLATMQAFSNQHLYRAADLEALSALADGDNFKWHFLGELYRVLGLHHDYSVDTHPHTIIQNQVIQRCLGTQASLGYNGASMRPSLSAIVAQTTLNLRYVSSGLLYVVRSKPGTEGELKNQDSVRFIIGLVSWLMALFNFIIDETFTLSDYLEEQGGESTNILDLLNQKIRQTNSPALPLLLISSSRTFLRLNCASLRSLMGTIKAQQGTGPLGLAYREMEAVFQQSPVSVPQFEHLLQQIDNTIRSAYQSAGIGYDDTPQRKRENEKRNNIEKDMLIKAIIPETLTGAVKEILTTMVNALKEEVNVAELYFTSIGWLGLTDDKSSKRWREDHQMDGMRKVELRKDVRTKRCTRCGALTEDMLPFRGVNMMVMSLQRYCICGSWFMVCEEEGAGIGFGV